MRNARKIAEWLRCNGFIAVSYVLFAVAGVFVFGAPSPSLAQLAGPFITAFWGTLCLGGGLAGLVGLIFQRPVIELVGATAGASASLTWAASLIMQAVITESAKSLTAACVAGALAGLFAQRWADANRPPQE